MHFWVNHDCLRKYILKLIKLEILIKIIHDAGAVRQNQVPDIQCNQ